MARQQTGGRGRALVFLFVGLLAAGGMTYGLWVMIQGYQAELEELSKKEESVKIVVAARALSQGRTLGEEDLTLKEVPPAFVPPTTFTDPAELYGRVPKERVLPGEYVREERLANPESGVGLNAIIPRGMRALSLNITNGSAVSGFLNPGNYVDVLVTIQDEDGDDKNTVTMLQAVQLLAVDNRLGETAIGTADKQPSVTMAVTPEQAQLVTHSNSEGAVTLTLRNDIDVTQVETHGTTASAFIGLPERTVRNVRKADFSKQDAATTTELQIIRGGNSEVLEYDELGEIRRQRQQRRRR